MEKNFKIIIFLGLIIVVLFLMLIFLPARNASHSDAGGPTKSSTKKSDMGKVCFEENCFVVEIPKTSLDMEKGLMFREHLDKNKGMLFIFDNSGNYPFWMKNTLIPLDMIWINQNQEVVFIKENAEPCKEIDCPNIDPKAIAKYVLEINGGLAKEKDIKIGDKIGISENIDK